MEADHHALEEVARARFGRLTEAESKLLRAAPKGEVAWCGPSNKDAEPCNDPANADAWDPERGIRGELIRWLCVDRDARNRVDPKGILVHAAKIVGPLDISFVAVPFPLNLFRCCLADDANLSCAEVPRLDFGGSWVQAIGADAATVKGSVFLSDGFRAEGEVRLLGAQIGRNLDCRGGTFKHPAQAGVAGSGDALSAHGATVKGNVFLSDGFRAEGRVSLSYAKIGGTLECHGGTFKHPAQAGVAGSGTALSAHGATVKGNVFLSDGFRAEGEVRLPGAQIEGNLDCDGGAFTELNGQTASVKGSFSWRQVVKPRSAKVNLINASVGAIVDDQASWPAPGNLSLDGFVYGQISTSPRDAQTRLQWLERQKGFSLQPYRQLARILRGTGDDRGVRHVLYEMEHRRRAREGRGWAIRVWGFVLRCTIGYGYYPGRAFWGLLALTALSGMLFSSGYAAGTIAPTDKDAYESFAERRQLPMHYGNFSPFVYSLENSFPLVKLGQVERWQPDPNPQRPACPPLKSVSGVRCRAVSPGFLRCFRWVQICLGWILGTLFVAGVTGIVRGE